MNEAAKEARRAYKRQWQRDNPDKVKKYIERYWEKKAREAAEAAEAAGNDPQQGAKADAPGSDPQEGAK